MKAVLKELIEELRKQTQGRTHVDWALWPWSYREAEAVRSAETWYDETSFSDIDDKLETVADDAVKDLDRMMSATSRVHDQSKGLLTLCFAFIAAVLAASRANQSLTRSNLPCS